jgi:hypothetical protein
VPGPAPVDVDPDQLSHQAPWILSPLLGVERAAAVAERDVEATVAPEGDLAPVVVQIGLVGEQNLAARPPEEPPPVGAKLEHARVAPDVRQVHVEAAVLRVPRVEGKAEEALLAAALDEVAQVGERLRANTPSLDDADPPRLLDHVQPLRLAGGGRDLYGRAKSCHDDLERVRRARPSDRVRRPAD